MARETAKPLAYYDHPFFGRWPAITRNIYGKGSLTYEGTMLSDKLQQALVLDTLRLSGVPVEDGVADSPVRIKHGRNQKEERIHYFLNFSSLPTEVLYSYAPAQDLLSQQKISVGQRLVIAPWDIVIAVESSPRNTSREPPTALGQSMVAP